MNKDFKIKTSKTPEMLRYQCKTCGNTCLQETAPDNSVCGGCKNPNWQLMEFQEPYKANDTDDKK